MKFRISGIDTKNWEALEKAAPGLAAALADLDPTARERFAQQPHTKDEAVAANPEWGFERGARERMERGISAWVWPDAVLAFHEAASFYDMEAALAIKERDFLANEDSRTEDQAYRLDYVLPKHITEMDARAEQAELLARFATGRGPADCPCCEKPIEYCANERGMFCGVCDTQFTLNTLPLPPSWLRSDAVDYRPQSEPRDTADPFGVHERIQSKLQAMEDAKPAFLTDEQYIQLMDNHEQQDEVRGTDDEIDFVPVVKLTTPFGRGVWLLTELDAGAPSIAFGLCDLGLGFPECGYIDLQELGAMDGFPIVADATFKTDKPLSYWIDEANRAGRITA